MSQAPDSIEQAVQHIGACDICGDAAPPLHECPTCYIRVCVCHYCRHAPQQRKRVASIGVLFRDHLMWCARSDPQRNGLETLGKVITGAGVALLMALSACAPARAVVRAESPAGVCTDVAAGVKCSTLLPMPESRPIGFLGMSVAGTTEIGRVRDAAVEAFDCLAEHGPWTRAELEGGLVALRIEVVPARAWIDEWRRCVVGLCYYDERRIILSADLHSMTHEFGEQMAMARKEATGCWHCSSWPGFDRINDALECAGQEREVIAP